MDSRLVFVFQEKKTLAWVTFFSQMEEKVGTIESSKNLYL